MGDDLLRTSAWVRLCLLFFLTTSGVVAFAYGPRRSARHDIKQLSFMNGCWAMKNGDRVVEEQWMAEAGGIMLGAGRTTRAGKLIEFEATRIQQHGDTVTFFATPSGQVASSFPARTLTSKEVVFEDLEHDFPQRVMYRGTGDSLYARVEGMMKGELKAISFPMARVSCTPGTSGK